MHTSESCECFVSEYQHTAAAGEQQSRTESLGTKETLVLIMNDYYTTNILFLSFLNPSCILTIVVYFM